MAIKYAMMKKAKMAKDGMPCDEHGEAMCHMCHGGEYADGGDVTPPMSALAAGVKKAFGMSDEAEAAEPKQTPPPATKDTNPRTSGIKKAFNVPGYAKGGFVEEEKAKGYLPMPKEHRKMDHAAMMEDDRDLNQHGEYEVGAEGMAEDNEPFHEHEYGHAVENQDDHEDMVGHIMKQRMKHYSKGGMVANDTPDEADFMPNDFDDLAMHDHLEDHYTGADSGDELGDHQEDEDRRDIVSQIMKSRRKKMGHNPRPA